MEFPKQTDQGRKDNTLDKSEIDKVKKTCLEIVVARAFYARMATEEGEKDRVNKRPKYEIGRIWRMKEETVTVPAGSPKTVTRKYGKVYQVKRYLMSN